jgi:putative PIN family toxin of toxin-antitoxin system
MRVTLDTNILVSAFVSKSGYPANILDILTTFEETRLVLSDPILKEFAEVMNREEIKIRFEYTLRNITEFQEAIRNVAEIITVKSNLEVVKEDPDEDIVVNTAVDGKADYIVSGDEHLKKLRKFRGIQILSPRAFMNMISTRFGDVILPKSDLS